MRMLDPRIEPWRIQRLMEELEDDFLFKTVNTFVALREEKMKENRLFKMLKNSKVNYTKQMSIEDVVNPFVPNASFL